MDFFLFCYFRNHSRRYIAANVVLLLLLFRFNIRCNSVKDRASSDEIVDRHLIPIVCSFKREHLTIRESFPFYIFVRERATYECELIESKYSLRMGAIAFLRFPPTKRTFAEKAAIRKLLFGIAVYPRYTTDFIFNDVLVFFHCVVFIITHGHRDVI